MAALALGVLWFAGSRAGRLMKSIGREAAEFWSKVPIPGREGFPRVGGPARVNWADSNADDLSTWREEWYDSYRVLTFAETGNDNPYVHGYLELRKGRMTVDGKEVAGIWGYPISLLYLGRAMCRVSEPGVWKFNLVPEQLLDNNNPFVLLVIRRKVFDAVVLGYGFGFEDREQAGRVVRRLWDICPVSWLTINGWFYKFPGDPLKQQYTVPYIGGTMIEVECNAQWDQREEIPRISE